MYIPFEEMPEHTRIWIYTAHRPLTDAEIGTASPKLIKFIDRWSAHGKNLQASFTIYENAFVILGVDQKHEGASGCSIDSSVKFLQELENELSVSLLNWQNYAIQTDNGIKLLSREELERMVTSGAVSPNISVYNNSITVKQDMAHNWLLPLKESSVYSTLLK